MFPLAIIDMHVHAAAERQSKPGDLPERKRAPAGRMSAATAAAVTDEAGMDLEV